MVSLTLIPLVLIIARILTDEPTNLSHIDRYVVLSLGIMFCAILALPIALTLERKNRHKGVEPMVKTLVNEMEAQRTKAHP